MKDPSSQKPSEEGNPSKDKADKPQPKMKLKPLVPTDQNSIDSTDDSKKTSLDRNQARLKLKHLMSPLAPHLQKVRESEKKASRYKPSVEPPPSAVPYDEPGVNELPPGVKPLEGEVVDGPPAEVPTPPPPVPEGIQLATNPDVPPQEHQAESARAPESEEGEKEETEKESKTEALVSATRKKPRLLKTAIVVVNILIILTAVQYFFDPLGLTIEPFEPRAPVLVNQVREDPGVEDPIANAIAPIKSFNDLEAVSLETFTDQLRDARILASNSPKGVIINSIFYPEGSTLHPGLGLTVQSIEMDGKQSVLKVVDPDGNAYEYPAN